MTSPARIEVLSKAMGDINEVVVAIQIASTLDQDEALRRNLRRHADCPDDQPLNLELPVGSAGLQLRPDGSIHPMRAAEIQPATNFDHLVAQSVELQSMIERAHPRITETVNAAILPFFFPGVLPSRDEYLFLDRWAPLIEGPAYRFCARALEELDSWRASALAEAVDDMSGKETVLERYYGLVHTVAHLTLLCSGSGATPWLSDMAKSFTWTNWTPTFPLVRERTVWLAAAAARSAVAFGAEVVDRYVDALVRATHVTKLFDALFGLTAIALSDGDVRDSIASRIAAEAKVTTHRPMIGVEFAEAAYRSAANCLSRPESGAPVDQDLLDRLSWRPGSLRGLGTREAFRVDPTDIDESGEMIGFRALPHILRTKVPFHFPLRPRAYAPLLPALEEMPELLRRAWGPRDQAPRTIH
jgi:hypothetical protein